MCLAMHARRRRPDLGWVPRYVGLFTHRLHGAFLLSNCTTRNGCAPVSSRDGGALALDVARQAATRGGGLCPDEMRALGDRWR